MKTLLLIVFSMVVMGFVLYMVRIGITDRNYDIITDAICRHNSVEIKKGTYNIISFDEMEPYGKTFCRITDCGYKNIVSSDVLKRIEPYIEKRRR